VETIRTVEAITEAEEAIEVVTEVVIKVPQANINLDLTWVAKVINNILSPAILLNKCNLME
jgi:hypothetical protein